MANPTCRLKDIGSVVRDDVDAVQLSQSLCRHGNENACPIAAEHVTIGSFSLLTLQQNVHLDLAIFVTCLGVVNITTSVEIGNDDNTLFVVVVIKEPSNVLLAYSRHVYLPDQYTLGTRQ